MMTEDERGQVLDDLARASSGYTLSGWDRADPTIRMQYRLQMEPCLDVIDRMLLDKYERKPPEPPLRWESPPGDTICEVCGRGFTPLRKGQRTCNSRHSDEWRAKCNRMHASKTYERKKREAMDADFRAIMKE